MMQIDTETCVISKENTQRWRCWFIYKYWKFFQWKRTKCANFEIKKKIFVVYPFLTGNWSKRRNWHHSAIILHNTNYGTVKIRERAGKSVSSVLTRGWGAYVLPQLREWSKGIFNEQQVLLTNPWKMWIFFPRWLFFQVSNHSSIHFNILLFENTKNIIKSVYVQKR